MILISFFRFFRKSLLEIDPQQRLTAGKALLSLTNIWDELKGFNEETEEKEEEECKKDGDE